MSDSGRGTVLIIDDDADIREAFSDALATAGFGVATARDGREALEVLANAPHPCLILLDLMMPVMNGKEFLSAARAADVLADIPVVIVSAYHEATAQVAAQGFLHKPIELADLIGLAKRYCGAAT